MTGALATALEGNTVVNELCGTNSKIISLHKTIAQLQLAIVSSRVKVADLNQFTQKNIALNAFCGKTFYHRLIAVEKNLEVIGVGIG